MGNANNPNAVRFREAVSDGSVQAMLDAGYTHSQIASYYKVSRQTMYNYFKPPSKKPLPAQTIDDNLKTTLNKLWR